MNFWHIGALLPQAGAQAADGKFGGDIGADKGLAHNSQHRTHIDEHASSTLRFELLEGCPTAIRLTDEIGFDNPAKVGSR